MKKIFAIAMLVCGACLPAAAQNVTFDVQQPDQINAGETFEATLSVHKPNIKGRFRVTQSFPERFVVEEVNSAGAVFKWDGVQAHYRWDSVPADRIDLVISVTPPIEATTFNIDAAFSYEQDGEDKTEYVQLPDIRVINPEYDDEPEDEGGLGSLDDEKQPSLPASPPVNAVENAGTAPAPAPIAISAPAPSPKNVYVLRQTPYREGGGRVVVRLQINKGAFEGYGRLTERITPQAGRITIRESKGARVETDASGIRFTWLNMPARDSVTLMYEIADAQASPLAVEGVFYFGDRESPDSIEVVERSVLITKNLPVPDEMPAEISLDSYVSKGKGKKSDDGKVPRSKNERGLVLKIQILATRRAVSMNELEKELRKRGMMDIIREDISEEYHTDGEGADYPYKYVTGHFKSIQQARSVCDAMQRAFGYDMYGKPKVYLVPYYNGQRITMQSALVIQNSPRR